MVNSLKFSLFPESKHLYNMSFLLHPSRDVYFSTALNMGWPVTLRGCGRSDEWVQVSRPQEALWLLPFPCWRTSLRLSGKEANHWVYWRKGATWRPEVTQLTASTICHLGSSSWPPSRRQPPDDASQGSRRTTWSTQKIVRNNKSSVLVFFFFLIKNKATEIWRSLYVAIGHWYIVCESSISSSSLWFSRVSGIAAYASHLSSSEESENTKVWIFVFWLIHTFQLLLAYFTASKICSWGLEFWILDVNHFWLSEKA